MSTLLSPEEVFDGLMRLTGTRLVQARFDRERGLVLFKYHRKVFYDSLWFQDPLLELARGIVFDTETKKPVLIPFDKVFNYGEQGTLCDPDREVTGVRKINGFMASAAVHRGELLVATTGTMDSDFAVLARQVLEDSGLKASDIDNGYTYLFEIVHESDPHIVPETPGAYFIGCRRTEIGSDLMSEESLDVVNALIGSRNGKSRTEGMWRRPQHEVRPFDEWLQLSKTVTHEGFMIRDGSKTLLKLKSSHYLQLKFLSRSIFFLKPDFDRAKLRESLEEEFYPLVDYIFDVVGAEAFKALDTTVRVQMLRDRLAESYRGELR